MNIQEQITQKLTHIQQCRADMQALDQRSHAYKALQHSVQLAEEDIVILQGYTSSLAFEKWLIEKKVKFADRHFEMSEYIESSARGAAYELELEIGTDFEKEEVA